MSVAHDDQRAEAEVLAALDDLGHAIDRHDRVLQIELRWIDLFTSTVHKIMILRSWNTEFRIQNSESQPSHSVFCILFSVFCV